MRRSKYSHAVLAPIVARARTLAEVLQALGLPRSGGNYRFIAARIRHAGLDTSHLGALTIAARCAEIPREVLAALVAESRSFPEVLGKLALPTEGRAHHELKKRVAALQLETSHFRGQGWANGETRASHSAVERVARSNSYSDAEVFTANSPTVYGTGIVRRLLGLGVPYACSWCGIAEWRGRELVLQLDHINGINNDNRRENLRLLCPNCHSQTETFGRRRRST